MPIFVFNMLPTASFLFAFHQSNLFGQAIVVLLFFGSIVTWSVMVSKIYELRVAVRETERFSYAFKSSSSLLEIIERKRRFPSSPAFIVYEAVCRRWRSMAGETRETEFQASDGRMRLTTADINVLRGEAEKNLAAQEMAMEDNMGLLATAVAAAPFLGLLGTVWGVMEAFIGMARTGSAMLSAVAPGISAALLTTVVGLMVALPSLVGHNYLVNRIRRSTMEMHNFAEALLADIDRQYGAVMASSPWKGN